MDAPKQQPFQNRSEDPSTDTRFIQPCDFRAAARLSNESTRALTSLNESFARSLSNSLSAYVRTDVRVRMTGLDQLSARDHVAAIPPFAYIASFPLNSASSTMILSCEANLAFTMIDLLLGGKGIGIEGAQNFSEIEEEIMQDLASLLAQEAVRAWGLSEASPTTGSHLQPHALEELWPSEEKHVLAKFELDIAEMTGKFELAVPASVAGPSGSSRKPTCGNAFSIAMWSSRPICLVCGLRFATWSRCSRALFSSFMRRSEPREH
jgi:flagellar motor switch protein FliM